MIDRGVLIAVLVLAVVASCTIGIRIDNNQKVDQYKRSCIERGGQPVQKPGPLVAWECL